MCYADSEQKQQLQALRQQFTRTNDELNHMRNIYENSSVLKEKNASLENKIAVLKKEHARILSELECLSDEKRQWMALLDTSGNDLGIGINSPSDMARLLSETRLELASAKEKLGRVDINYGKSEIKCIQTSMATLAAELESERRKCEMLADKNRALDGKRALAEKRCSLLEQQIQSYDLEEVQEGKSKSKRDYRILMLADNPTSRKEQQHQDLLESLKIENETLRTQIMKGTKGQAIPMESYKNLESEKTLLESQLQEKEKRILRLKQVFASKVQEYLAAVVQILGFRLEMLESGAVRVFSVYGKPNDPGISYNLSGVNSGNLEFVGGDDAGVKRMEGIMAKWMESGSLPCLMASVTLALYRH